MVRRLDLSGFVGFDFVIDSSNQAWIIEMNPRVTPICHFSLADGTSLAGALYAQMKEKRLPSRLTPLNRGLIALFPDGIARSPPSEYLRFCQLDVPWDEPELVRSVFNEALRTKSRGRVGTFIERYLLGAAPDMADRSNSPPHLDRGSSPSLNGSEACLSKGSKIGR
jgi:hypothetical protein